LCEFALTLTDDPFFLEELQFGCNWQTLYVLYVPPRSSKGWLPRSNAFAWGLEIIQLATSCLRRTGMAAAQGYWQSCIADNKAYALRFVVAGPHSFAVPHLDAHRCQRGLDERLA
jgi:hypothetical protein